MRDGCRTCLSRKTHVGYGAVLGGKARLRVLAALVGAVVFTATSPFPKASALTSDEGALLSYVNSARANYGKKKLSVAGDLMTVARQHSAKMASKGAIFHNSSLGSDVHNWKKIGENVGRGGSAKSVHQAFMASSSHRVHILDGAYDYIGIGAVWGGSGSNRYLYVTEIFVDRAGGSTTYVSTPKSPPKKYGSKPKPKPRPKPKPLPAAPPPPLTIDFLLQLLELDVGAAPAPLPPPDTEPVP